MTQHKRCFLLILFLFMWCGSTLASDSAMKTETKQRPNILWITIEDWSPDLACYGTKGIQTPHVDKLAAQGIRYQTAFTTSPVCSPSRSAMMTGFHQNYIGAHQHRTHDKKSLPDSWKKTELKLADAKVPAFYPDNEIIRGDLLDYGLEVQWFDLHVGRAVEALEERGLLDNTLIIVTSDHGMPFPRVKGQLYEEGFHVPMIAYWQGVIKAGRIIDDFVSFPDVAPTLMQAVGLTPHVQMTGKSFLNVLRSPKSGQVDPERSYVLLGKERHDTGRASEEGTNLAYPVRAIRTPKFLYVHNLKPDLWPVGNPEYGLRNCDASPTKSFLTSLKPGEQDYRFYEMSFGKRPSEELYLIEKDPDCMTNLALNPEYATQKKLLRERMETELATQGDPRTLGLGDVFDAYPYVGKPFNYKKTKRVL